MDYFDDFDTQRQSDELIDDDYPYDEDYHYDDDYPYGKDCHCNEPNESYD